MSIYSSGKVKTKLVEPTTENKNLSVEFRIHEPVLPNLRLVDVGTTSSGGTAYNELIGIKGLIRSIFLYDGQLKLDGCPDVSRFLAFKNLNKSNTFNRNLNRFLSLSQQGYGMDQTNILTNAPLTPNSIATTDVASNKGRIELNEYLPLLDNLSVLDPSVFKNGLRIVIEFNQDSQFWEQTIGTSHITSRMRLIMDCVSYGSFQNNPSVVQWNAIESDRFVSDALDKAATTLKRPETHTLNGFNNKSVSRILMCKNYNLTSKNVNGSAVVGYGPYASFAQLDEVVQVTVNGAQLLPRNGVEGSNRMLSMLNDTWGESNVFIGNNQIAMSDPTKHLVTDLQSKVGQVSYFGCYVNQPVKNFQVTLTRSGLIDTGDRTPTNEALLCSVFAEVSKIMTFNASGYDISYN